MNAVTVRRLLVLGVCAVGVSCLYVVPGLTRAPVTATTPRPTGPSTPARASSVTTVDVGVSTSPAPATAPPSPTAAAPAEPVTTAPAPAATGRRPSGATPFDPSRGDDVEPPAAVVAVQTAEVTTSRLTLRWDAVSDNVGVVAYRVELNGFEVARTAETHATVRWFNDGVRSQVVQVKAVDAAGNQSATAATVLVERPTTDPTPTPMPTPEPTLTPTPTPTPEPSDPGFTPGPTPTPTPSEPGVVGEAATPSASPAAPSAPSVSAGSGR